jgi:BirA family biotin operon repressor/biotin-[acetyl-CoA-carboxylase] ligase
VDVAEDLRPEAVAAALPGRPVHVYPALLSTGADALAWARAGAPEGAVVVADYQASARGRAGLEWQVRPEQDLAFSLVLRPRLPPEREGWLYTVAVSGVADALGGDAVIEWPDEVRRASARAGAVGVHVELGPEGSEWAVVNVLVAGARPPRTPMLARTIEAIETRYRSPTAPVLADYLRRCETIGRAVRARLIPLGPGGPEVAGTAVSSLADGALVLETKQGNRVAVRPQHLGLLEPG